MSIRVRLSFNELVPGFSKKTWFLFDTASCRLVADLEHLIQRKFELRRNLSVNLYHEDFLLPAQEKIDLVRDGDVIRVEQQANFCKDKKIAKLKDDEDTSSAKKQKRDHGESQKSVLNGKEKKTKSNQKKNVKNQARRSEKTPIRFSKAERNRRKRLQSDDVGKPCKDSTSSSSSSEDSSDNACNKNFKSPEKIYVSSSTSLSSSSSSMLSSSLSSSKDPSDDNQKQGLNSKTKGKRLNKNNGPKPNIHPATTASAKKQNRKFVKNPSKTLNQSKKDGSNTKTKEKVMDKNTQSKTAPTLSGQEKVETARNRSNILDKETPGAHLTNGNSFPSGGITCIRSKSTLTLPSNLNNSHIRFDSDEEKEENLDSITPQNQGDTPYFARADENINTNHAQENRIEVHVPSHNDINGHLLNNGEMDRNGNGRMDKRMGHHAATKKTAVDYSTFPPLCGPPRVGDRIAYKVLELSASYTPEMSDYKEGTVLGYNPVRNEVMLELTDDSLTKPLGDGNISTKFELIYEDEYEENNEPRPPAIVDRKVSVLWTAMVDPRLITS